MRQPKFRGVSKETNKWIYGFGWFETDYTEIYLQELEQTKQDAILLTDFGSVYCHIDSMGQYTGVKDKNGVEIYEGDICRKRNTIGVVVWANEYQSLGFYLKSESGLHDVIAPYYMWDFEVIGNIHKNPELLEGDTH